MKYIQDRLNGQGKNNYQMVMTQIGEAARVTADAGLSVSDHVPISTTVMKTEADAASCKLSYSVSTEGRLDNNFTSLSELSVKLLFRDVDKLVVEPYQDYQNRATALALSAAGLARNFTEDYNPRTFVVRLILTYGRTLHSRLRANDLNNVVTEKELSDVKEAVVPFQEEEAAQRMAKAIVHAVELCGGGKDDNDPFK